MLDKLRKIVNVVKIKKYHDFSHKHVQLKNWFDSNREDFIKYFEEIPELFIQLEFRESEDFRGTLNVGIKEYDIEGFEYQIEKETIESIKNCAKMRWGDNDISHNVYSNNEQIDIIPYFEMNDLPDLNRFVVLSPTNPMFQKLYENASVITYKLVSTKFIDDNSILIGCNVECITDELIMNTSCISIFYDDKINPGKILANVGQFGFFPQYKYAYLTSDSSVITTDEMYIYKNEIYLYKMENPIDELNNEHMLSFLVETTPEDNLPVLDDILDKISESGMDSLNPNEIEVLQKLK